MDTPRARENEPLSVDAVARAARAPFAEARGRGRCAENGGDDAAGFDEAGRQAGIVDAGDMGDDPGCKDGRKVISAWRYPGITKPRDAAFLKRSTASSCRTMRGTNRRMKAFIL